MIERRINKNDTVLESIISLSNGEAKAVKICMLLVADTEKIDPDSVPGGIGNLLSLDEHNIYGLDIWKLYYNVCDENIITTVGCLRAVQLGILPISELKHGIDNNGEGIDTNQMILDIKERLPKFGMCE